MNNPAASLNLLPTSNRRHTAVAAAAIVLGALAAYRNTLRVPFLFDDAKAIVANPGIRHLWPLWSAFWPRSADLTVSGRPVANLTLAVNFALSGREVWSYHALNLLIHILSGLVVFGLVRRTLQRPVLQARFGRDAAWLAMATALLWTLHPLQTEAVTYIIQRVESLAGLFYLLTFYCFVRSVEAPWPRGWQIGAVAACLLGMATKEVVVTAPVLVLLYDRTFVAGSFRDAWRRHRWLHLGLAATWLPLAALVASTGWNRGGSAGFGAGVAWWSYWLTQFGAITRYLRLAVWPHPLVFDYGTAVVTSVWTALPGALLVALLAGGTAVALRHRPALGFAGAWLLAILAPTSIVPVATQTMAEHRMYLPLAAVAMLAVIGIHGPAGRRSWVVIALLALGLGVLTARRNHDYRSELAIWSDTVAKRPDNSRARGAMGLALDHAGRTPEALQQFEAALRLAPGDVEVRDNLGVTLERAGRTAEAIWHYETALRYQPDSPEAHSNLGVALDHAGRTAEAIRHFEVALRLKPDYAEARNNFANVLRHSGRLAEAMQQYQAALRLLPDFAPAHHNLGEALEASGQISAAMEQYEAALRFQPDLAEAQNDLGVLLCRSGRVAMGLAHLNAAVRLRPDYARAHFNLGVALVQAGRTPEAIQQYSEALRLQPDLVEAHNNLGMALGQSGRFAEAIAELTEALRLRPDNAEAHHNLGNVRLAEGQWNAAIAEYEEVLRLRPGDASARQELDLARARRQAAAATP